MVILGLAITAICVLTLVVLFLRARKSASYPAYGFVGLAIILVAEILLFAGVEIVQIYFTPICWTGFILAIDAAIFSIRGRSMLRSEPQAFLWMAILSLFLWLIFEIYNLELNNWMYVGLPQNIYARYFGYGWAFMTIWPAVMETAEFLRITMFADHGAAPPAPQPTKPTVPWMIAGVVMLVFPLLVPFSLQIYLFGLVWLGFILLADPLNYRARRPSLWGDLSQRYRARLWSLLLSGAICGFIWEFWNYWATAKWLYLFPILEEYRIFEMPFLGFLGFPAFALEIFAMYVYAVSALNLDAYELE